MGEDPSRIRADIEQTREPRWVTPSTRSATRQTSRPGTRDRITGGEGSRHGDRVRQDARFGRGQGPGQARRERRPAEPARPGHRRHRRRVPRRAADPDLARRGREDRPDGRAGPRAGQARRARRRSSTARRSRTTRPPAPRRPLSSPARSMPGSSRTPHSSTRKRPRAPSRLAGIRTSAAPAGAVGVFCYSARSRSEPGRRPCATAPLRGMVAVAATVARAAPSGSSAERDHEGTTVGQADVREVQDHPPPRAGARDLPEPTTQAATGVGQSFGSNRRGQHPPQQARRDRPHVHLRGRAAHLQRSSSPSSGSAPTPTCAT